MGKLLKMDLNRMIISWKFIIAIVGIAIVSEINSLNFDLIEKEDIIQIFTTGDAPFFSIVILIFETLPYGTAFCSDWENKNIYSVIIRSSPKRYAVSKVTTCFIGSVLVGVLGRLLYIAVLLPFADPINPQTNTFVSDAINYPRGTQWLLANHYYYAWICIQSLERSLQGSIFAAFSLFLSTKITNLFVTLAMPAISYYVYLNIANFLGFPNFLLMAAIFENEGVFPDSLICSVCYAAFYAILMNLLLGYFFQKNIKRRLENG